ncbi:MAG TPA: flippase [Puia sp.]|jgi:lipopolysaccharide exporter|nr:flippase [Puia sp.]
MSTPNRRYWLQSGFLSLMINFQNLLFGFGSFFFLVRMLDKPHFGIWSLFIATTTIFDSARSGMIQNALIKYLSDHDKKEHPLILTASFYLSGALMVACIIVNFSIAGYLAHIWKDQGLINMFYAFNIVYLLQGILYQFQWIEQANFSFKGVLLTSIIRQGGFFLYIVLTYFLHWPYTLLSFIWAQAGSAFVAMLIQYLFVSDNLVLSKTLDRNWVKTLFSYGKYVFGTNISGILTGTINQMMLGGLLSADAAGAFNVAVRITTLTEVPTNALGTIVFPQSAKRFAADGKSAIKYLYEKSVGTILAILIPSLGFLFIFPDFVVHTVAGSKYPETIPIIRITVLYCLLTPYSRLFGTILDSIGKPRINFIIIILFTTTELVLTWYFIIAFGMIGAVYATLAACVIFFVIMQVILANQLKINFLNTFVYAVQFYPEFYRNYVRPRIGKKLPRRL